MYVQDKEKNSQEKYKIDEFPKGTSKIFILRKCREMVTRNVKQPKK